VARYLGVSQSTVSLALSGAPRVSEATRQRVLDACDELGYRPVAAGRRLRTGRSHTIGLFVPKLGYEVFDRVLQGVREGLATADASARWSVLVASTDNDLHEQAALTDAVQAHDFDGLILAAVNEPDAGPLKRFAGRIVAIETAPPGVPRRSYDLDQAARTMLGVLLEVGHRRIGHLSALPEKTAFAQQRQALVNAIATSGTAGVSLLEADAADVTLDAGIDAIASMLALPEAARPTAIVCDDSRLAAAVYAGAADVHLHVPADLSVICSHLDDVGRGIRPALTGLYRPAEAVGSLAALALVDAINGVLIEPEVLLPCELVAGASVAPAPATTVR
jgi:LacI family transcriptional regulator